MRQPPQQPDTASVEAAQVLQKPQGFDATREMENLARGRQELDAQIKKMQESLARRQNLTVDPRWAAFTYAMSQPSKTGSAFEAMGSGLGAYSKAEQEDITRQAEVDKLNLELLGKRQQLQQQMAGQSLLNTMYGPPGVQTPMDSGQPLTTLAGAPGGASGAPITSGAAPITGTTGYNQFRPITERDLMMARAVDPETEKFLMELRKSQIEAQKAAAAGYTKVKIPDTDEEVNVPIEIASQYFQVAKQAALRNDPQMLIKFMAENAMIPMKRTATGEYAGPQSKAEKEAEIARLKAGAEKEATLAATDAASLRTSFQVANDIEWAARNQAKYAETNPTFFNLLQDTTVRDSLLRMLDKSQLAGVLKYDAKEMEAALKKVPAEQRTVFSLFLQNNAFLQLMYAKHFAKGEGSVSDNERRIFAELGALPTDSALAIRLKSEQIIEKAKFNKELYQSWLEFKKATKSNDFDQFMGSRYYSGPVDKYNDRLDKILEANTKLLSQGAEGKPAAPAAGNAKPLPSGGSSVPPGYIRDPKTGVIRKKREGE